MIIGSVPQAALEEAITASIKRDERATSLLSTFESGFKWMRRYCVFMGVAFLILGGIVLWNWRASNARAAKFETVLICDSNSQRAVAVDIGKARAGETGQFLVPVSCGVAR